MAYKVSMTDDLHEKVKAWVHEDEKEQKGFLYCKLNGEEFAPYEFFNYPPEGYPTHKLARDWGSCMGDWAFEIDLWDKIRADLNIEAIIDLHTHPGEPSCSSSNALSLQDKDSFKPIADGHTRETGQHNYGVINLALTALKLREDRRGRKIPMLQGVVSAYGLNLYDKNGKRIELVVDGVSQPFLDNSRDEVIRKWLEHRILDPMLGKVGDIKDFIEFKVDDIKDFVTRNVLKKEKQNKSADDNTLER